MLKPGLFLAAGVRSTSLLDQPKPGHLQELKRRTLLDRCWDSWLGWLRIPQPGDYRYEGGETQGD